MTRSFRRILCRVFLSFAGLMYLSGQLKAQPTVWNNSGTDWGTSGNWTNGTPNSTTLASFDPSGGGATVMNPVISGLTNAALGLNIDNNFAGGTYSFSGTGTLTLGTGGLIDRAFGTTTFTDATLAGAASNNLTLTTYTGAGLTLAGLATAATNAGQINIFGGTLSLDNTTTNTSGRLSASSTIVMNGGGTFAVLGNSTGSTFNVGPLNVAATVSATTPSGGVNTISVNQPTSATSATVLSFANTGTISLLTTPNTIYNFVAANGTLARRAALKSLLGPPLSIRPTTRSPTVRPTMSASQS